MAEGGSSEEPEAPATPDALAPETAPPPIIALPSEVVPAPAAPGEPADLEEPAAVPIPIQEPAQIPTVADTVRTALNALVEASSDLRRLSIVAVVFGVVLVAAPLLSAVGFFLTFPLFKAFGATDDPLPSLLALVAAVSLLAGMVGYFVFAIQFPLLIVAVVGGRISGRPLDLRQGLRRARQVFWRAVGASIAVGLVAGLPAGVISTVAGAVLGVQTQLTIGVTVLASVVLSSPWVYVLPSIVLGGVGVTEALRRSWRLARFRWRLAVTIATFGVVGGQIVSAAALTAIGAILTLAEITPGAANFATTAPPLVIGGGVLVAAVVVSSLFFATQAVEVAPETSGFYALTGYANALDEARTDPREPLLRRPARVIYTVGVLSTIAIAAGIIASWPVSERGPWQRQQADSLSFDTPAGWQKVFEDPAGAGFSSDAGSLSIEIDVAGSSVEDLALRHFATLRPLPVDHVAVGTSEDVAVAGGTVREILAEGQVTTDFPFQLRLPVVIEFGRIGGVDAAFIVDYPASDGVIADLYASEAKRFARHIWMSATGGR